MSGKTIVTLLSLLPLLLRPSSTHAQSDIINLNAGLQAQVLAVGRDKTFHYLTVSMILVSKGPNTIYLMLLESSGSPSAVDNAGATFSFESVSGVPICPVKNDTPTCIGVPNIIQDKTPPLQNWMELDPNTSPVTLNVTLFIPTAQESHGRLVSFSCTFASRVVSDPRQDDTLSETQKRRTIHVINLSFPPMPVTQE